MNSATFWIGLMCSLGLHFGISIVTLYPWGGSGINQPLELSLVTIEVPSDLGESADEAVKTAKAVPLIKRAMAKKPTNLNQKVFEPTNSESVSQANEVAQGDTGSELIKAAQYGINPEYPRYSRQHGQMGTAIYKATFLPDGSLHEATLEKSSGFSLLDDAALRALQDAKIPKAEGARRLAFRFVLQE